MLRRSILSSRISTLVTSKRGNQIKYSFFPFLSSFSLLSQERDYHKTISFNGRNDGASGGFEKPREFSKKQKKRFKLKVNESKEKSKRDPLKHQKMEAMKTHMESPETKEFIKETEESVLAAVREAMLPDGLQSLLAEFDGFEDDEEGSVELQDVATRLLDQLEDRSSSSRLTNTLNKEMVLTSPVTSEEANAALVIAGEKGSKSSVFSLLGAMETLQIPIYPETITQVMNKFIQLKEFLYAEAIFEKSLDIGTNPNSETWSSLIQCKAASGDIASAQVTMDRLIRIGVIPTLSMYHSILRALLDSKQNEKAFDYWMRMKAEGIGLNVESYNLMLQHCLQIYNPERAFLYFDEMKGIGRQIQPNAVSYAKLFEVCGYAPMWVNGYQDIIFDAMAVMEGNEFPPNTEIYNQIIKSFGRAGDSEAAEFYFWEMRQKKIPQTIETYNNLFGALAWYHLPPPSPSPALSVSLLSPILCSSSGQRVGNGPYMIKPRYVRPPESADRNELQDLMLRVGALKTNELKSSSFTSDGMKERGKRQMHASTSDEDNMDNREITESLTEALRAASELPDSPDYAKELRERDEERKLLYETETGRTITLDLLAKGVNPGPGRVLHILPDPSDFAEEPSQEDIFSTNSNSHSSGKSSRTGASTGAGGLLDHEEMDEEAMDELPDDDPEFQQFMKAFKASMGNDNFDSMLETLDQKLGEQEGRGESGGITGENPFDGFEVDEEAEEGDEELERDRQRTARELLSDTERGLVDLEKMEHIPTSNSSRTAPEADTKHSFKRKPQSSSASSSSFDFDSMNLGDLSLLSPKHLVKSKRTNPLLALLDNEPLPEEDQDTSLNRTSPSSSSSSSYLAQIAQPSRDENGVVTESEVDRQWNFILFARCPEPTSLSSKPLLLRRKENISRANALYEDLIEHGLSPNVNTLTAYLSVYSEATKLEESLNLLDKFASRHDLVPDANTYLALIRMHIFLKDINGAKIRFAEMKARDLKPTGKIYGHLIQSLTHRDELVEALQLLEEASEEKIHISNTFIKKLRRRCEKLGVTHPNLSQDPEQWVRDVKEFRKKTKSLPVGSRVHLARSMSFT